ncbi:60S ribosomal protein L13 [Entamoeba marina]
MKHNQAVSNIHFCKDWKRRVHTWFKQPFRKIRRHQTRVTKAKRVFPATIEAFHPSVHCMTQRYNYKLRLGRGFTLKELKLAKIDMNLARTVGISVDTRRKNKSVECLNRNAQRLQEYMSRLVVLPRSQSEKAIRLVNNKKNAEKKAKKAKAMQQYIAKHNKTIKDMKVKVAAATKVYAQKKDAESQKELAVLLKALKKEQKAFGVQAAKEHKANIAATKPFNKLPVQLKKDVKQVLDANKVIRLSAPVTVETKTLTKGMTSFNAVARLRKQLHKKQAVGGIIRGQRKAANAPAKKK